VIALIFSWLSKVLRLYSGLEYLVDPSVPDPMTVESWFLLRIVSFRITMIFTIIALLYNYILKINLFEAEENKIYNYIIYGYAGGSVLYMIIVYIKGSFILDLLTFVLILIYICLVMIPLMISCFQAYKAVDDPSFKRGFISLFSMALSIILIFICQVIDRILMITLNIIGYTFFYFLGWSFAIVAIFFAYFGYINPKSKKE
jgi:hypothetical protein